MDIQPGPSKRVKYGNADFEESIKEWLDETESDLSDLDEFEEKFMVEEECEYGSVNDEMENCSSSEDSEIMTDGGNELETTSGTAGKKFFYGKNGYKWCNKPFKTTLQFPEIKSSAIEELKSQCEAIDFWNLLFREDMLEQIMLWSNCEIERQRMKYSDKSRADVQNVDLTELKAFLGLLIYTSVFKSNKESIGSLFATDGTGRDIFRAVMNQKRFAFLMVCLRFDNPEDRNERKENDPSASISELFAKFTENCQSVYSPGTSVYVDAIWVGFRGRCRFKTYLPSKPVRYGIKILCATDTDNNYFYNGYIDCVKDDTDDTCLSEVEMLKYSKPTRAVLRLCRCLYDSYRNVMADSWFSSVELTDVLWERGLTYVGTLEKNKSEIPKAFLSSNSKKVGSSMYGFLRNVTLLSYIPETRKAVIALSTMHHTPCTDVITQTPEIIAYYNTRKNASDALGGILSAHSCSRQTRRWPMAVFFRMLDLSTSNAFILYRCHSGFGASIDRAQFLKKLAKELVQSHMKRRLERDRLKQELQLCIRRILDVPQTIQHTHVEERLAIRKSCSICPPALKRKTQYLCVMCKKPVCLGCTYKICKACEMDI